MKNLFVKLFLIIITAVIFAFSTVAWTQEVIVPPEVAPELIKAVMCESIEGISPVNEAIVFSVELGRVLCFTEFDPVPQQTVIYHRWYYRGVLISQKKLTIKPPRWASFSSMQLRDTDIGPWQVEITDADGNILHTLRFSITE